MQRIVLALVSCTLVSCSAIEPGPDVVLHGRIVDSSGSAVGGAFIEGFHQVPTERAIDPNHPPWNGLLGQTSSNSDGSFVLTASSRASLDYILARHGTDFGVARAPFHESVRIRLRPYKPRKLPVQRQASNQIAAADSEPAYYFVFR